MKLIEHYLQHLKHHQLILENYQAHSEAEVQAFEHKHRRLPELLRQLYLRLDGQRSHVLEESNYRLLPIEYIDSAIEDIIQCAIHHHGVDYSSVLFEDLLDEGFIQNVPYHKDWLPFMELRGHRYYALDYAPEAGGKMGQILLLSADRNVIQEPLLVYDTLEECFEDIIKTSFEDLDIDPSAESFEDFMNQTYEQLRAYDDHAPKHQSALLDHWTQHIGTPILHHESDGISIYRIKANTEHPYQILFTVGMSNRPMHIPEGISEPEMLQFAELFWCLPAEMDLDLEAYQHFTRYLLFLADLPFAHDYWLVAGHSFPIENNLEGTEFSAILVAPPLGLPRAIHHLHSHDGTFITNYALMFLYRDEFEHIQEHGLQALIDGINRAHLTVQYQDHRPSLLQP